MKRREVIIDADPGIDDAIALALATYSKKLDIKLITTVCGNVTIDKIVKNTLNLLQAINITNIPVSIGAEKPIARKKDNSIQAHGKSGLGNFKFPKTTLKTTKENAVDKMYEVLMANDKKITIIALGPLTNVATLLSKYPDVKEKIECVVFSGGLLLDNQSSRYFGFNIQQDPEAAQIVWQSGVKLEVVPSDHGHYGYLTPAEIEKTNKMGKTGAMLYEIYKSYKDTHVTVGIAIHDAVAIAYVTNPEIFRIEKMYTQITYVKKENNSLLDFDVTKAPNANVATSMNVEKFKKLYFNTLKRMP